MFGHLLTQLSSEVETVRKALTISERLRDLLTQHRTVLAALSAEQNRSADEASLVVREVSAMLAETPDKLDWQIYDHCAALTRLYSAYERFVGDLVDEYVDLLPELYKTYDELPSAVTIQHRVGIAQILLKIGDRGPYKQLTEHALVGELAAGLSGASGYKLMSDAFFIDRQNLRFEVLVRLFSTLGFEKAGRYINRHQAVLTFIRSERADSSSTQKELEAFIDYRNEAAHRKVENVIAIDAIAGIGRFVVALGSAIADLVEEAVLQRRMELGDYDIILAITEIHHDGRVVIGVPNTGVALETGADVVVFGERTCYRARIESLQLNGNPTQAMTGDGATEVGIRLSKKAPTGGELRTLRIPTKTPAAEQLVLDQIPLAEVETADTDIAETGGVDVSEATDSEEQATAG